MLLCMDTSAGVAVALIDGREILARARVDDPRRHTESLAPLIAEVLAAAGITPADLTGIVAGTGPAPFTGLRVGLMTGTAMAQALGIDVYGVSVLAGLARQGLDEGLDRVRVLADARRKEVYWATYGPAGADDVVAITGPAVAKPADLAAPFAAEAAAGTLPPLRGRGVQLYPEAFAGEGLEVDAAALGRIVGARLAAGASAADLPTKPLYLRRPDIHQGPAAGRKRAS